MVLSCPHNGLEEQGMAFDVNTSTKTSTGQNYSNQYDLQRQKIREEEQKRKKQEQAALQRALASRGFTAGSGFTEAQQRNLAADQRAEEKNRLSKIDVNQLSAAEAAAEAERARRYGTSERLGTQEFQTSEAQAAREAAAAETERARRYGTSERLGTQAYQTGEREATQEYEGAFRQQDLDQAATEFASQMDFDYWATQAGYTDSEKQRAWQERQNTLVQNATALENEAQRSYEWDLTQLQNQLNQSNMTLQETIDNNTAALKNRVDLLYAAGQLASRGGKEYDVSNLSQQEQDAYELGRLGVVKEDADQYYSDLTKLRDSLIVNAVEDEDTISTIQEIFNQYFEVMYPEYTNPVAEQ
jgi:hypothetical protein